MDFEDLFNQHYGSISRFLLLRLPRSVAEDVASQTFLEAFRSREHYDPARGSARAWLFGIANTLASQHRERERRHLRILARAHGREPGFAVDDEPASRLDAARAEAALAKAIAGLKQRDREVLLLVAVGELSYGEVAHALEIPPGTVKSRMTRIRTQLADALAGEMSLKDRYGRA